jgi:hypothetical protein
MAKDATLMDEGVSAEEGQASAQNPEEDPRLQMMEGIAERARKARDEEFGASEELEDVEPEDAEEQDQEESEEEDAEPGPKEPKEQYVRIVVDGEEREVPLSQIMDAGKRTLQKESAADRRLEEATRLLNEAKQRAAMAQQGPPATRQDAPPAKKPDAKKLLEAIRYAEDDEAEQALNDLLSSMGGKPAETNGMRREDVIALAENVMVVKDHMGRFQRPPEDGGFGDIAKDPDLYSMAGNLANTMRAQGRFDDTNWQHYQQVGEAVRKWRDTFVQRYAPKREPVEDMTAKKERKRSTVSVTPANVKSESSSKPTKTKTHVEIAREGIADIMRARGQ